MTKNLNSREVRTRFCSQAQLSRDHLFREVSFTNKNRHDKHARQEDAAKHAADRGLKLPKALQDLPKNLPTSQLVGVLVDRRARLRVERRTMAHKHQRGIGEYVRHGTILTEWKPVRKNSKLSGCSNPESFLIVVVVLVLVLESPDELRGRITTGVSVAVMSVGPKTPCPDPNANNTLNPQAHAVATVHHESIQFLRGNFSCRSHRHLRNLAPSSNARVDLARQQRRRRPEW
jgi:hypothetical protein